MSNMPNTYRYGVCAGTGGGWQALCRCPTCRTHTGMGSVPVVVVGGRFGVDVQHAEHLQESVQVLVVGGRLAVDVQHAKYLQAWGLCP